MSSHEPVVLHEWKSKRGVDCRILRKDNKPDLTWGESWYDGRGKDKEAGWRVWLQFTEANAILDALGEQLRAQMERDQAISERDAVKAERDALKAEVESLKNP